MDLVARSDLQQVYIGTVQLQKTIEENSEGKKKKNEMRILAR